MRGYGRSKTNRILLIVALCLMVILIGLGYMVLSNKIQLGTTGENSPGLPISLEPTPIPQVRVLYANRPVPAGIVLSPEQVDEYFDAKEVPQPELPFSVDAVVSSESQLENKVTLVELQPEEVLRVSQFADATLSYLIPKGKRAMPIKVDNFTGIAEELAPNDFVDLVFSAQLELHFPEAFPCPYQCSVITNLEPNGETISANSRAPASLMSVKTIIQDLQVLKIVTLTTAPATSVPAPATPPEDSALGVKITGWILILAVDDQQAEVIKLAVDQSWAYQVLLRAHDDHIVDPTGGATINILIDNYGVPVPKYVPYEITPGEMPTGMIP